MKVFVYGSLKKGFHNHSLIKDCEFLGDGRLEGATMYKMGSVPYPSIKLGTEDYVFGEIYEVDTVTLYQLDRLEGYTGKYGDHNLYNRMLCSVRNLVTSEEYDCYVYVWAQKISDNWIPLNNWEKRNINR